MILIKKAHYHVHKSIFILNQSIPPHPESLRGHQNFPTIKIILLTILPDSQRIPANLIKGNLPKLDFHSGYGHEK
jgi:hypothetical protein